MSVLKTFVKDTFVYGLAIVLPRVINFLLVKLYTGTLENEQYSLNTEFYVVAAFFNVFLAYGMETSFFRFFSQEKEKNKVLSTALVSMLCSTVLFGVLLFLFKDTISSLLHIPTEFYSLLVSITLLDALIIIPFAYIRVTGKSVKFAVVKIINVLVLVILNVLFLSETYGIKALQNLFNVPNKVEYTFIANLIASSIVLLLVSPYFFKVKWKFDGAIFKKMLSYGWPIMVAGVAFVINENFDKWYIPEALDKHINGSYSAVYKLTVFMTLFIQAFRMGAEPFFFNQAKAKNAKQNYATILKYFTIVACIGLMLITTYIDIIKAMFIDNDSYLLAINIVPIVLLANVCFGIYQNLSIWYKLTDKTYYGMYISIVGAIITVIFNIVMIPKIGFMASAYATLLAYSVMMIISYSLGKKHYKVPYETGRIVFYLLFGSAIAFITYYGLNRNVLLGTVFLMVFLAIVFLLERKELKQLLNK